MNRGQGVSLSLTKTLTGDQSSGLGRLSGPQQFREGLRLLKAKKREDAAHKNHSSTDVGVEFESRLTKILPALFAVSDAIIHASIQIY